MAIAKKNSPLQRKARRNTNEAVASAPTKPPRLVSRKKVITTDRQNEDFGGMGAEEWKMRLKADIASRFGPDPDDLRATSEPGW